ncbi:ISL3 family transposase [Daejeonella sp.]|uniref:ISL3 family transposase n=1 Tax=Daejeonella sp. TaxID=2805397 RepID=UPI00272F0FA9|nr:ISL3 family transposase [Daejeonella sp.]MDP2414821.1 ISL3 family transposase [Daejeonella sp.]
MEKTALYHKLLELDSNWKVNEVELIEGDIVIFVEYVSNHWVDKQTGEELPIYDLREERMWRHLNTMQYKTFIHCRVPRVRDSNGKVRTIDTPWAKDLDRFTVWFEAFVIEVLLATKNQTKTAKLLGMGFNQVNRIMHRASARGLARRDLKEVVNLSIDEKSFRKGHQYVSVLSSPDTGAILNVTEDRTQVSAELLLTETFGSDQLREIQTISLDMWKAFINAAEKVCPKAALCHDKFHLVQHMNKAVDQVRREETKTQHELKKTRYIWLKDHAKLTDYQREMFDTIKDINLKTAPAWRLKEMLRDCIPHCSVKSLTAFTLWLSEANRSALKPVIRVAKMFTKHLKGILNALGLQKSNAMAERLNGKIQELKTVGRGYRTFINFKSAILFFNGKLDLLPQGSW